jgi:hypothetical protein
LGLQGKCFFVLATFSTYNKATSQSFSVQKLIPTNPVVPSIDSVAPFGQALSAAMDSVSAPTISQHS